MAANLRLLEGSLHCYSPYFSRWRIEHKFIYMPMVCNTPVDAGVLIG